MNLRRAILQTSIAFLYTVVTECTKAHSLQRHSDRAKLFLLIETRARWWKIAVVRRAHNNSNESFSFTWVGFAVFDLACLKYLDLVQ